MTSADAHDVFVVQRETDGVWEADCCSPRCGWGQHNIAEFDNEAAAQQAATEHRRELAAMRRIDPAPASRCPTCKQRIPRR